MDIISAGIIACWAASIPLRLYAVHRLWRERLMSSYPLLAAWLFATAIESGYLLHVLLVDGSAAYEQASTPVTSVRIALTLALAGDCLYRIACHFHRVAWFALGYTAAAGVICATVSMALGALAVPDWEGISAAVVVAQRFYLVVCFGVVLLFWGFFRLIPIRQRANADAYVGTFLVLTGGHALLLFLFSFSGREYWIVAFGQYAWQLIALFAYWRWSHLSAAGDVLAARVARKRIDVRPEEAYMILKVLLRAAWMGARNR